MTAKIAAMSAMSDLPTGEASSARAIIRSCGTSPECAASVSGGCLSLLSSARSIIVLIVTGRPLATRNTS